MKGWASFLLVAATGAITGTMMTGCAEDADVAGAYTVNVTNRENGCMFANWMVGNTATAIPVTITQEGVEVTARVEGVVGGVLTLALGANVYAGEIDGNAFTLRLFGTRPQQLGNCSYTYNSVIFATLSGDALTGRIEYLAATNDNPDCAPLEGCVSFQDFNGTRPPQ